MQDAVGAGPHHAFKMRRCRSLRPAAMGAAAFLAVLGCLLAVATAEDAKGKDRHAEIKGELIDGYLLQLLPPWFYPVGVWFGSSPLCATMAGAGRGVACRAVSSAVPEVM